MKKMLAMLLVLSFLLILASCDVPAPITEKKDTPDARYVKVIDENGLQMELTVHGYTDAEHGFYVKSDEYVVIDVKLTNLTKKTIYQTLSTMCHGNSHKHELRASFSDGAGHYLTASVYEFLCSTAMETWSLGAGESYEWTLEFAAGVPASSGEGYDLPAHSSWHTDANGKPSSGIKLYGAEIYTGDAGLSSRAMLIFDGKISFPYSFSSEYAGINDENLQAELSLPFLYVDPNAPSSDVFETTSAPDTETTVPIVPLAPVTPEDEEAIEALFTAENEDGLRMEVRVYGFASQSIGSKLYVRNDKLFRVDVRVQNLGEKTVWQYLPTYCRADGYSHHHEIDFDLCDGDRHTVTVSKLAGPCPEMIEIWSLAPGEEAEWTLELVIGEWDGDTLVSYGNEIYENFFIAFSGFFTFDYFLDHEDGIKLNDRTMGTYASFEGLDVLSGELPAPRETETTLGTTDTTDTPPIVMTEKPVIYLYPEKETEVTVRLDYQGELICTYPPYNNGWRVLARPDGTLLNLADGYEYSYLFWDGIDDAKYEFDRGYCIKGEDTADFLRETLSKMGLTPREYNEFIVYWLPRMQNNPYNLITFAEDAYTDIAPLEITPSPESLLRVFMVYKPVDAYVEIEAPEIRPFERRGFTVVEWGGSELFD